MKEEVIKGKKTERGMRRRNVKVDVTKTETEGKGKRRKEN